MLSAQQRNIISSVLEKNGKIGKAWVFGSFARNEETEHSDIDILFSFKPGKSFGLLEMMKTKRILSEAMERKIDFIHENGLRPFARKSAMKDRELIFSSEH